MSYCLIFEVCLVIDVYFEIFLVLMICFLCFGIVNGLVSKRETGLNGMDCFS